MTGWVDRPIDGTRNSSLVRPHASGRWSRNHPFVRRLQRAVETSANVGESQADPSEVCPINLPLLGASDWAASDGAVTGVLALDQTTTKMTRRYALGAISEVLQHAAAEFESLTAALKRAPAAPPKAPKPPRPRKPR